MATTYLQDQEAGVHSIDHFALTVPDIEAAKHFFDAFGLEVHREQGGLAIHALDQHCWGRIFPGPRKALAYLLFNCYETDLPRLIEQIAAAGGQKKSPPPDWDGKGCWFHDPDGNLIGVQAARRTMPGSKSQNPRIDIPPNTRGALNRRAVTAVRPNRMSHVLLFTPSVSRSVEFYARALGLRVSDRSGNIVAFMHAPHGCDHHLLAFAGSSGRGWHHSSWDVADVDQVGLGAAQMAAAGYVEGWGTGRHVLGSNYFHYVRDPWGSFAEYSAQIDYIDAGVEWLGQDHNPEDSLYLWGPAVPAYFIENTEVPKELSASALPAE
jgi:catechol 2,3-dioxygenase-like lactoylglutathione lyase family enzyme